MAQPEVYLPLHDDGAPAPNQSNGSGYAGTASSLDFETWQFRLNYLHHQLLVVVCLLCWPLGGTRAADGDQHAVPCLRMCVIWEANHDVGVTRWMGAPSGAVRSRYYSQRHVGRCVPLLPSMDESARPPSPVDRTQMKFALDDLVNLSLIHI